MDENISEIFSSVPGIEETPLNEETEISTESHVDTKDDNRTETPMATESLDNSELSMESEVSMEFKDYAVENISSDDHAGAVGENHQTMNESEPTSMIDSYEYVNEIDDVGHVDENVVHEAQDNPEYAHENKQVDDASGEIEPERDLLEDLLKFSTRNVPYADAGAVEVAVENVPLSSSEYPIMQSFNREEYCMGDDGVLRSSVGCDLEGDVVERGSKRLEDGDNLRLEVQGVDDLHVEVQGVGTEVSDVGDLHAEGHGVDEQERHELESGERESISSHHGDVARREEPVTDEHYDKNKNNVGIDIEHEIEKIHCEVKVRSVDESSTVDIADDDVLFEIKRVNVDVYRGEGETEASAAVTEVEEEILPPMPRNLNRDDHSVERLFDEEKIKREGSLSIAEAISRDFDETDSEDADKIQGEEEEEDVTSLNEKAAICDSGTMTVRDSSGQVYIVETVDDMLMFDEESFMQQHEDQPETVEVTVIEERYGEDALPVTGGVTKKEKKVPPIPSHVLGRNIINPADDTFR